MAAESETGRSAPTGAGPYVDKAGCHFLLLLRRQAEQWSGDQTTE
jgi:hypothetical protein